MKLYLLKHENGLFDLMTDEKIARHSAENTGDKIIIVDINSSDQAAIVYDEVYLVWYKFEEDGDSFIHGIYSTEEKAKAGLIQFYKDFLINETIDMEIKRKGSFYIEGWIQKRTLDY